MTLTEKLLGYLNRVFDKDPDSVLALRLNYDGAMTWRVSSGVLTTSVTGGTGGPLTVSLSGFSISGLSAYLAAQPGYSVPFTATGDMATRSALALMETSGNPAQSNGDHLMAFQSVLWAYLNAQSAELSTAQVAISEALLQIAAITASDTWVDEHGSYYGVSRTSGEADASYVARIVSEITRARGNGVAIAEAVKLGATASYVTVADYPTVTVSGGGVGSYGLFDVDVEVPVESVLSQPQIEANTLAVLEAMRDAGTHVRNLRYIRTVSMPFFIGGYSMTGHTIVLGPDRFDAIDGYSPPTGSVTFSAIFSPTMSDPTPHAPLVAGIAGAGAVFGSGDTTVIFSNAGPTQGQTYNLNITTASFLGTLVAEFTLTGLPATQFFGDFSIEFANPFGGSFSGVQVFIGGDDNFTSLGYRSFLNIYGPNVVGGGQQDFTSTVANISSNSVVRIEITSTSCVLKVNGTVAASYSGFTGLFDIPPTTPGDPSDVGLTSIDMSSGGTYTGHAKGCTLSGINVFATGSSFTVLPVPAPPVSLAFVTGNADTSYTNFDATVISTMTPNNWVTLPVDSPIPTSGAWYVEFDTTGAGEQMFGVYLSGLTQSGQYLGQPSSAHPGVSQGDGARIDTAGGVFAWSNSTGMSAAGSTSIGVSVNHADGTIRWYKDGVLQAAIATFTPGQAGMYFAVSSYTPRGAVTVLSSADATPPSGFSYI